MASEKRGKTKPSEFLKTVLGRPVVVKLNSGVDYRGALTCVCRLPRCCELAQAASLAHDGTSALEVLWSAPC